jgi:hypothetical protein
MPRDCTLKPLPEMDGAFFGENVREDGVNFLREVLNALQQALN